METRQKKQIISAGVFCVIVFLLGFGIFRAVVPAEPATTPNPTANLSPLAVLTTKLLNIRNNEYDFVAKVSNPNTDYGSGNVQYVISFTDASGKVVLNKSGTFYIFPGQTKYVVVAPLSFSTAVSRAEFEVNSIDWQKLEPLAAQAINLIPKNVSYSNPSSGTAFARVGGAITNTSDIDYDVVDVAVVVLDASGGIVAVNKTTINTFLNKTERGFEVSWFVPFVGQVLRAEAQAGTNAFNNLNFLRKYGGSDRFQTFY